MSTRLRRTLLRRRLHLPFGSSLLSPDTVANEATLLDTDYDNFLFLCLKDTTTPIQSMMCQYLGGSHST